MVKSIDSKDIKEEMVEVAPDINIWKNRIDPKLSSLVIQRCDEIGFERSKTFEKSEGFESKHRTSENVWISPNKQLYDIDQQLMPIFTKGTQDLADYSGKIRKHGDIEDLKIDSDEGYNLLRYKVGQEYNEHNDDGPESRRIVSIILYLNDDYEGGELHFRRQNVTIKSEAGDMFLFPSCYTHPHRALPVTSGIKYCIVTWCR